MGFISMKLAVKFLMPFICAFVLFTLKSFLILLAPLVNKKNRTRYLQKVDALGLCSDIGIGPLFALANCLIVYFTTSLISEQWVGIDNSRFLALVISVLVFYGYFFISLWAKASFGKSDVPAQDEIKKQVN